MSLRRDPATALAWQQRSQQTAREKQTKRKPIAHASKKELKRKKVYAQVRAEYLEVNPFCERCLTLNLITEATQIHHKKGRVGLLLVDKTYFAALCLLCHSEIHANPELAYDQGWMVSRHTASE